MNIPKYTNFDNQEPDHRDTDSNPAAVPEPSTNSGPKTVSQSPTRPIPIPLISPSSLTSVPSNRKRQAFDAVSPPQQQPAPFVPSSPSPSGNISFIPNNERNSAHCDDIDSMPGVVEDQISSPTQRLLQDDSDDEILAMDSSDIVVKKQPISQSNESLSDFPASTSESPADSHRDGTSGLTSAALKRQMHEKRIQEYNSGTSSQSGTAYNSSEPLLLSMPEPASSNKPVALHSSVSESNFVNPILSQRPSASTPGTTGLSNLGNTCFMNSALQCLSNTASLTQYFLTDKWNDELNTDNPLGMKGDIPKAYADLIHNLWNGSHNRQTVFSPRNFKYVIGQLNSTFQGYGQQDSHELLSSLLDGLHEDLNRIKKREYVEDPEMGDMSESEFARVSWEAYRRRNDSIIVDLFQGQLRNRTECQVCGRVSIKFDPYMYLQVPLPDSQKTTIQVRYVPLESKTLTAQELKPRLVHINVSGGDSISAFKTAFAKWMESDGMTQSIFAEVFQGKIYRILNEERMSDISSNDVMYLYDTSSFDPLFNPFLQGSSTMPDVIPLLISSTFDSLDDPKYGSSSFASTRQSTFGIPIYLPAPSILTWKTPTAVPIAAEAVGKTLYTLVVRTLRRFSRVPLFRKKSCAVTIADIASVLKTDMTPEIVKELLDKYQDQLGPRDLDDTWEPIPGLFRLWLVHTDGTRYNKRVTQKEMLYPASINETNVQADSVDSLHSNESVLVNGVNEDASVRVNDGIEPPSPASESGDLAQRLDKFAKLATEPRLADNLPPPPVAEDTVSEFKIEPNMEIWIQWDREVASTVFGAESLGGSYSYRQEDSGAFSTIEDEDSKARAKAEMTGVQGEALSVEKCLKEYSKEEILDGDDTMYCSRCKQHQPTKKKLEVYSAPDILVIHLKRFSNTGRISRRKIDAHVAAPLEGLNLRNILVGAHENMPDEDVLYDLYAVSNHFGGLGGGHYTAYVKNPLDHKWYNCDDSSVSPATGRQIVTEAAYLLFYKRRSVPDLDLKEAVTISTANYAQGSASQHSLQPFRSRGPASLAAAAALARAGKPLSPQSPDELAHDVSSNDATAENSPNTRSPTSPAIAKPTNAYMDTEIPDLDIDDGALFNSATPNGTTDSWGRIPEMPESNKELTSSTDGWTMSMQQQDDFVPELAKDNEADASHFGDGPFWSS